MRHIRIGKDIRLRWAITTDGAAIPLEGRDLTLEMKSPIGKVIILPYRVDGNVLTMTYYGYEQTVVGEYSLTLWENKGKPGQNVVDAIRAFKLVRTSPEEEDFIGGDLQVESVDLGTANLEILSGGGATTPGENPDLSALEGKVAANTASISQINEELDHVREEQTEQNNSIAQIHNTLEEHADSIASNKTSCDENAAEIERVSNLVESHEERLGTIDTTISNQTESINGINNTIASHIESTNSALSALGGKVDANTASISQHTDSIAHINTTLEEHSERIAQLESSTPGGDSEAIAQINSTLQGIKTEQTEQNNRLADHEERLVYTEGDLVKVREEYNSIISELVKSIGHTQKAFVVETNDSEGVINIDNVKKIIPPNSRKGFIFEHTWNNGNSGIASFRLLVTNTSSVENMSYMFKGCSSLTSLDVSNFDTSKVTRMYELFSGCHSLTSLDVSNFETSLVTDIGAMFAYCSSLTSLDFSSFDTSKVTSMYAMFFGCSSLTSLDLSNFNTLLVTNMNSMFNGCSALTSLDLSNFDTSQATGIGSTFNGCSSLTSLLLGTNFFKTAAVTIIDFSSCSKWTNETVVTSLVTNSYDRAAAGLNTLTLKLHANTKAALTEEQKATITNKGYTIA